MSFPKACCTLKPVVSDYVPIGDEFKIGDLSVYETKDKAPKRVLICVYDIFGVHENIRQFSDKLADGGYRIVVPDFFRGRAMDRVNFPPKEGFQAIFDFVDTYGPWETVVKADILNIIEHYKQQEGIRLFGIFGFCYGGRISIDAATEIGDIKAVGLIHPSRWVTEDANGIMAPSILLPAKDEPDMIPFYEILKQRLGEDKCAHRRFDDMVHGFAGARGNYKDSLNAQRVNEAIALLNEFFQKHVI